MNNSSIYGKVDPQEIIDKLDQLIIYFEQKNKRETNDEKELPDPPMDRN